MPTKVHNFYKFSQRSFWGLMSIYEVCIYVVRDHQDQSPSMVLTSF